MTNFKNSKYESITTKRSVPLSAAMTGVATTQGIHVIGVGTSFKDEVPKGSWIVDLTSDELRKVVRVESDTEAILDFAFSSDLASAALQVIHKNDTNVTEISVIIPLVDAAGADNAFGEIDGVVFPSGLPFELSKSSRDDSSSQDFIDPIIVDGEGTLILATTLL